VVGLGVFLVGSGASGLHGVLLSLGLFLLVAGLSAAGGYQVVARRSRSAVRFTGPSPFLLFGLIVALVSAAQLILVALGVDLQTTAVGFLTSAVLLLAAYVVVVWLFGFRTEALDLRALGIVSGRGIGRWISDAAFGAVTMIVVAFAVGIWGSLIATLLDTTTPDIVPVPTAGTDAILVALAACVLIPIGEELFFRGYALTAWRLDMSDRPALIRATVFFALIHLLNVTVDPSVPNATLIGLKQAALEFLVIAPVGLALGLLFLRRGIVASIAGHAAFNSFGIIILILGSGAR
jgi:membrane protease YdiL (CAAX protease family)